MALEDFTTYTEVDGQNKLTVAANTITWTDLYDNAQDAHVYKDMGVGHFGDFEHLVSCDYTALNAGAYVFGWVLANQVGNPYPDYTDSLYLRLYDRNTGADNVALVSREDGATTDSDSYGAEISGVRLYHTIERIGAVATCKIYSDASRTNLLDTLSITSTEVTFRYVYGFANLESGDGRYYSGHVYDLDLQEVPPPPAHFMQPKKYW